MFNVHTGRAHKWGARSPWDKDSAQAQFGLPLELTPFLKLHTGSIIDFKKNNTSGGERSTCPIKTKKSLDLFKVGLILTVFFQTSWNVVLQASKVTVVGVCSALIPLNPICELISFIFINYRISRTNNPNLRARNHFFKQLLKDDAVRCRVNVIQTDSYIWRTNGPAFEANAKAWPKPTEGERGHSAFFPKGFGSRLGRV